MNELNRATETIERMQHDINTLQNEIARMTIRREEGSHEIAERLVRVVCVEKAHAQMRKTKDRLLALDPNMDFNLAIGGVRYTVSVREVGPDTKKRRGGVR